jgi:hypothetical protein
MAGFFEKLLHGIPIIGDILTSDDNERAVNQGLARTNTLTSPYTTFGTKTALPLFQDELSRALAASKMTSVPALDKMHQLNLSTINAGADKTATSNQDYWTQRGNIGRGRAEAQGARMTGQNQITAENASYGLQTYQALQDALNTYIQELNSANQMGMWGASTNIGATQAIPGMQIANNNNMSEGIASVLGAILMAQANGKAEGTLGGLGAPGGVGTAPFMPAGYPNTPQLGYDPYSNPARYGR